MGEREILITTNGKGYTVRDVESDLCVYSNSVEEGKLKLFMLLLNEKTARP